MHVHNLGLWLASQINFSNLVALAAIDSLFSAAPIACGDSVIGPCFVMQYFLCFIILFHNIFLCTFLIYTKYIHTIFKYILSFSVHF